MCAYYTLKEYLLPKIADFGNPESAEVQKIEYYAGKFDDLFRELMDILDWYSADGDATVEANEKMVRFRTLGDITITGGIESEATELDDVIHEIETSRQTERGNREDDKRSENSMEERKKEGYF